MARTTNYDGRRVSLSIYDLRFNYDSDKEQGVATTLNSASGGYIVAGIAKLCQSVLVLLLSDDVVFDGQWGTSIPRLMGGSVQWFGRNVEGVVKPALSNVVEQMQFNEKDDAPDDERIADLTLADWDYTDDGVGVTMRLVVTSVAGESRDVVVPLNITI